MLSLIITVIIPGGCYLCCRQVGYSSELESTVALLNVHISMRIARILIFYIVLKNLIILDEFYM